MRDVELVIGGITRGGVRVCTASNVLGMCALEGGATEQISLGDASGVCSSANSTSSLTFILLDQKKGSPLPPACLAPPVSSPLPASAEAAPHYFGTVMR